MRRERAVILAALSLAAAVLLSVISLAQSASRAQRQMGERVDAALEVREAAYAVLSRQWDAERVQRYFLLSGVESDLAGYHEANGAMRGLVNRLVALGEDEPVQRQRIRMLDSLLTARRAQYEAVIAARRTSGLEAARALVLRRIGVQLSDALERIVLEIVQHEERQLARDRAASDAASRRLEVLQWVAAILTVLLIAGSYAVLSRLNAARRKAAAERDRAFELSQDLLCTVDGAGRFLTLSPSWEMTLGYPLAELVGRPFIDLVHPEDRERTLEEFRREIEAGARTMHFINRYRDSDGTYRIFSWSASTDMSTGLVYAAARDITEIERANEQRQRDAEDLAHALAEVTAANRELEAFTYTVSHDLRAPLRHIDGFSALLEEEAGQTLDPAARAHLGTIRQAVGTMGRLIDGLLKFSRLGRAEMHVETVRLDDLALTVLGEVHEEVKRRRVNVETRPLPVVLGDAPLLGNVLRNLVGNALKFTRTVESPTITIGSDAPRDALAVFFVRDNGVGFDMKLAAKLFGVFQRLHSADEFEGSGVGLATVERIVHRHGGRVWAEAAIGKGATFYVALPPAEMLASERST